MAGTDITLPVEPFISVGGGILIALVTGCFALLSIWLKRRLDNLDNTAQHAADLARPTGNGYAGRTEEALADLKKAIDLIGRDVGGIRSEARETNRRLNRVDERLTNHLEGRT